ncbi:MAG TPA: 3-deoxy-manno-octulosonate cytidylyltransferase [Verrucomicrobiota bacterium]|nr:3-deoxy-manno-octulosonate cytidylyltransferase [Verrucomicrobiota bacterium]
MRIIGVIPARYGSTRFPGKPLVKIAGKPLIQWVVEQAKKTKTLNEVIVATDDERIKNVAKKFCNVEMTLPTHPSGTDRIAEVVNRVQCDAVVNIQGDEPLIEPSVIDSVAQALSKAQMSTAATAITEPSELDNPNVVKVVLNGEGFALYFSRSTIPYLRDVAGKSAKERLSMFQYLKHLGIYGYNKETLKKIVSVPVSPLERAERLEQLRALELGIQIAVIKVAFTSIGVDTPQDVERVAQLLIGRK